MTNEEMAYENGYSKGYEEGMKAGYSKREIERSFEALGWSCKTPNRPVEARILKPEPITPADVNKAEIDGLRKDIMQLETEVMMLWDSIEVIKNGRMEKNPNQ